MLYEEMIPSIFRMSNFFDEISIIDTDGIIRYCEIFTSGTYSFTADEILGKHVFEVFSSSSEENSEIYQVLKTGKPNFSYEEECMTYKGDVVRGYSSIYPIYQKNRLVGAALALKFLSSEYQKGFIQIQDNSGRRKVDDGAYTIDDIITVDPYMIKLKNKIRKVSNTGAAVLIQGKTGTGKELVAQSLHYSSNRASGPFISQNCSAIPGNLLESTLFGTDKGSYTGAITNKGLFELADGGTLFLDEINSMELSLQGKLLKAIETKSVRHLGGHEEIKADVRIVAAINEDPFDAIEQYRLRSDLFYRLNVISFQLSALKDRLGDIAYLTDYYIDYYNKALDMDIKGLDPGTVTLFSRHTWPGNVRELRNIIEGAFAVAEGEFITLEDIPEYLQFPRTQGGLDRDLERMEGDPTLQEQLDRFEQELVKNTVATSATKAAAAKRLGITKQNLNYRLNKALAKEAILNRW